jgi:RNA polymerase sigma-70 factor (ECF subfamily)
MMETGMPTGNLSGASGVYVNMADLAASTWSMAEEDVALVSAVRAGSEEAFDRLLSHYQASVYNVVYRIVGNPQDAADTVQEVFLKVYRGLDKFQGNSSLKTWIFRIAVHEGCNYKRWWRRHAQRESSLETCFGSNDRAGGDRDTPTLGEMLVEPSRSPFESTASQEVRNLVDQALNEMPEHYRTAVVLRDLEDLSYEEITEVLGVSLGTVKSRVGRGREALRKRLTKLLPAEAAAANRYAAIRAKANVAREVSSDVVGNVVMS